MSTYAPYYEAVDDEAIDDEAVLDDEALDDEAEFLPGLGNILPGIASGIGGLLFPGAAPRPPLPQVNVPPSGGGVSSAVLQTPQGSATLRLPETVVTKDEFRQTTERLQEAINRDTARLNTTQKDIESLGNRVGTVVADTRRDISRVRAAERKHYHATRAAIGRLRREQASQNSTNLLMTVMMQQQIQSQIANHTHPIAAGATATGPATVADSNNALMFLPLMMMGGGGGDGASSDNNMMMMLVMMMAFTKR
jgi:hypothetical protein